MEQISNDWRVTDATLAADIPQAKDSPSQKKMIPLDGKLVTSQDPATIGVNFKAMSNLRYTDTHLKTILGHSKINTTALTLTSKSVSAFHFKKDRPAESHVIVHHDGAVYENLTAIPSVGDFSATPVFTDTATSPKPRFSMSPDGSLAYCNGTDVCLWPGAEGRVGAFLTSTAAITTDLTNPVDSSSEVQESNTVTYATVGGGIDANTKLILHMDGSDGSVAFTDSSPTGRAVTAVGSSQIDTTQYKFGYSSGLFNGTTDYLTVPDSDDWAFGTAPFTIDYWVRFKAIPVDVTGAAADSAGFWGQRVDATHYMAIQIFAQDDGGVVKHAFDVHTVDGASDIQWINHVYRKAGVSQAFAVDTWYHIALIRGWDGNPDKFMMTVNGEEAINDAFNINSGSWPNTASIATFAASYTTGGGIHYTNGWIDEFRVTKGVAQWTAPFTPPTSIYRTSARDFLVGSTFPLQGMKAYVGDVNATASALTMKYWDGVNYVSHALTDGTSAGSVSLAQTGDITWASTVGLSRPRYVNGYYLYWYNFSLSAGGATIYYVTINAPFQPIQDIWDGVERPISSFIVHKTSDEDYSINVYREDYDSGNTTTYADLSNLTAGTQYIYVGFPERMTAINFNFGGSSNNAGGTNPTSMALYFWGGGSWDNVGPVTDGTLAGGISFAKTGTVSWTPPVDAAETQTKVLTDVPMFYYKVVFDKNLDADVKLNYVSGIPKPKVLAKYKFPFYAQNSLFLCGDTTGYGNKALVSSAFTSQAFNGASSYTLEFEDELTGAVELYSQFFSSLYSLMLFFSMSKMYIIAGVAPDWGRYVVSNTIGCPAPNTIRMINLPETKIPAALQSRNVAIWQGNSGLYVSDGRAPIPIHHDIEDLFDMTEYTQTSGSLTIGNRYRLGTYVSNDDFTNCGATSNATGVEFTATANTPSHWAHETPVIDCNHINPSMLTYSWGFVDPVNECYHWIFATGTSTYLNKELIFDFRRWKWFPIDRPVSSALQAGCVVADTNGNAYNYAVDYSGYLRRLNNGRAFDSTSIPCHVSLGDFPLIENDMMTETIPDRVMLVLKSMSNSASVTYTHATETGSGVGDSFTLANQLSGHRVANVVGRVYSSVNHLDGVLHSGALSITQSASETIGFEPMVMALTFQVDRDHTLSSR